jgi:deoxyribodipyrimidine photo-lyase
MPSLDKIREAYGARVAVRRPGEPDARGKCVVHWMQRAQRSRDNHALDVAVEVGNALNLPVVTFFAPVPYYPNANLRHYRFLQQGIADIAAGCAERGVGFVLRRYPEHSLLKFCDEVQAAIVIGDENPMREPESWRQKAAKKLKVSLWTVDADVIVPSVLLEKAQYAARIIRPRLKAQLPEYLREYGNASAEVRWKKPHSVKSLDPEFDILEDWKELDRSVEPVTSFTGGYEEGMRLVRGFVGEEELGERQSQKQKQVLRFAQDDKHKNKDDKPISSKLANYPEKHNIADEDGTSRLSPYLHFGHVSPLRVALMVKAAKAPEAAKEDYLDQLITWRELSINLVRYCETYDTIECADNWAHKTLAAHAKDKRPHIYTRAQLEKADTGDELWNAAQRQMLRCGWMHNYMRMYWAKKILEWTPSPAVAYQTAVYLNDKYFLDGRDPNGYAGIAWAIAGKFDRPWFDRPIFGQIRYMNDNGAKKKFDVEKYIAKTSGTVEEQGKLF